MVAAANSKAEIRDAIIADLESKFNDFDALPGDEYKSEKYDLHSRQGRHEGAVMTLTKGTIPGLTLEMHATFRAKMPENVKKMNSEVTMTKLDTLDGASVIHQHIKMPMLMTNRSLINLVSVKENDDGTVVILNTSQKNEDLLEQYKDKVGKDVIACNYFNYQKLTPVEGGLNIQMASCMDPMGSIPDMFKNKAATRMLKNAEKMYHFMMTGEVLK